MILLIDPSMKRPDIFNNSIKIFLAGSIEMGKARRWQEELFSSVKQKYTNTSNNFCFLNPYRKDFDENIENTIADERFMHQVSWEWEMIDKSDLIVMNFEDDTKSPITLLELGAVCAMNKKLLVRCSKKFWKYGNVEFMINYYKDNCIHTESFNELIKITTNVINDF
jgi:hypothetical protein